MKPHLERRAEEMRKRNEAIRKLTRGAVRRRQEERAKRERREHRAAQAVRYTALKRLAAGIPLTPWQQLTIEEWGWRQKQKHG